MGIGIVGGRFEAEGGKGLGRGDEVEGAVEKDADGDEGGESEWERAVHWEHLYNI